MLLFCLYFYVVKHKNDKSAIILRGGDHSFCKLKNYFK